MKSRILLLPVIALAGVGASYALADNGGHHAKFQKFQTTTGASCQRTHVHGTASAPQTFVVTVTKAGGGSSVSPNQVVTVSVGQTGQTVGVNVEGCLTGASSLAAREAELHAFSTVTTQTGTTGTTTTGHHGDGGDHHGRHHGPPPTTTGTTTTGPGG